MRPNWASMLVSMKALLAAGATAQAPLTPAAACTAAEYRQFDFFAGDWDTYDMAAPRKVIARNHVSPMVGGCALREVYLQNDGLLGESFSTYDAARQVWHQSWVTNRGQLLLLEGTLAGGRMVLIAREAEQGGESSLVRATWWRIPDAVRETAERSRDGGRTWTPVFDIVFRPHSRR